MKSEPNQKRIIILSIVAALVYTFIIANSFYQGWDSFKTGYWISWNENHYGKDQSTAPKNLFFVTIKPSEGYRHFPDTILNLKSNTLKPMRKSTIEIALPQGEEPPAMAKHLETIQFILFFIIIILYIVIPVVFILLIRSLYKGIVFHQNSIRRTRKLGIMLILLYLSNQGLDFLSYQIQKLIFSFQDYEHIFHFTENHLLMMGISILLMTEIMSRGLKLKEEQDLTI